MQKLFLLFFIAGCGPNMLFIQLNEHQNGDNRITLEVTNSHRVQATDFHVNFYWDCSDGCVEEVTSVDMNDPGDNSYHGFQFIMQKDLTPLEFWFYGNVTYENGDVENMGYSLCNNQELDEETPRWNVKATVSGHRRRVDCEFVFGVEEPEPGEIDVNSICVVQIVDE